MENNEDGKPREEIVDIYTPLSVAKEEIWKRWNDKELKKRVDDFLRGDVPNFIQKEPQALLVRQITSPDVEFFFFLELSKLINLKPLFVEFQDDKFSSCNPSKYYRCNMYFQEGIGKEGEYILKSKKIVDIDAFDGKIIKEVKTFWNTPILSFHHELIKKICPENLNRIVDVSHWAKNNGKSAENFYLRYLSWFICHGVLFENFLLKGREGEFTRKLVLPNIRKLEKEFGVRPLIVPTEPSEDADSPYWWSYSKKVERVFEAIAK